MSLFRHWVDPLDADFRLTSACEKRHFSPSISISRLSLSLLAAAAIVSPVSAATYTWDNLTSNGSQGFSNGYTLSTNTNWAGDVTPTFNNQAELVFTGLGAGSHTVYAGSGTTILNRLTIGTESLFRINSASSTLSFQGSTPTIDVQSGTFRLEVILASSAGITKTGAGAMFSNLQSASGGFTGDFTIDQGLVTSGNNFALGDQKTVNIRSGGAANMNGQFWGSSTITTGSTVSRNYTFNIAGTGVNGSGAITNLSANAVSVLTGISGVRYLNLTADASVGGSGDYNLAHSGTIDGNGFTLTKTGANSVYISGAASDIAYAVSQGRLVGHNTDNAFGGAAGSVAVAGGATLASYGARTFANAFTLADTAILENLNSNVIWSGAGSLTSGLAVVKAAGSTNQITLSGILSGAGGLDKQSANTLLLSNANTYAGKTKVSAGTLRLGSAGSIGSSSEIQVMSGATLNVTDVSGGFTVGSAQTLSGGGTVTGNTVIAGSHTPGFSPGLQTFTNNLTYASGADITWELAANSTSNRGTFHDAIDVQGNLTFQGPTTLALSFTYIDGVVDWTAPFWDTAVSGVLGWKIFGVTGTVNGFANLQIANANWLDTNGVAFDTARPTGTFSLYQAADGIYLNYTPVPEPSTYGLMLGGLALAGAALRRRRKASK